MKGESIIHSLVEDCVARRLSETEAIGNPKDPQYRSFFMIKLGRNIARSTYYNHRRQIFSEDGLNMWFNSHTKIGFVKDQRMRNMEMNSVMDDLMKQWSKLLNKPDPHPNIVAALAHAITDVSRRLGEVSLDNPIISQIKLKIDTIEQQQTSDTGTIDYTQGTAFS